MYVGLDMGGTHTDVVLIADGRVQRYCKTPTDPEDYLHTVTRAWTRSWRMLQPAMYSA